jgi:hypothetical protein
MTDSSPIEIEELLRECRTLVGDLVAVRGFLVVPADGAYLVPPADAGSDDLASVAAAGRAVVIDQPTLVDNLLRVVPAWVGGPYYYRDDAVIRGTLELSSSGAPTLRSLTELTVLRPEANYRVVLAASSQA